MDELIARVTTAAGLDTDTAQQGDRAILGFLRKEGPAAEVDQLFAAMPGASAVADAPAAGGGGLMGMLGGMGGGGGLMALARSSSARPPMGQMQPSATSCSPTAARRPAKTRWGHRRLGSRPQPVRLRRGTAGSRAARAIFLPKGEGTVRDGEGVAVRAASPPRLAAEC